jgi:fatty-acyl-CoA synthase
VECRKLSSKPFVLFKDTTLAYGEFSEKARRLANGLRKIGIRNDDKVGLFMMNAIDYMLGYFAVAAMGGCAVPLNTAFTPYEVAHQLNDSDAAAVIADGSLISNSLQAQP